MITLALALMLQAASLGDTGYRADTPMAPPTAAPAFRDEFEGSRLDRRLWRFDTERNADGWHNHERQYYSDDRAENTRIEGGALVIEARRERLSSDRFADWGGQDYTSARLVTRAALGPGFYEVRALLPCARGTWPAIWMLPATGTWPEQGEIDIMEMVGWDPGTVHATLHTGLFNHAKGTQRGSQIAVPTSCTEFHRYQLEWRDDAITIGVDDRAYMRIANDQPGGAQAWPFTRPFHLILNLAVGGDWGGQQGIDDAALPQRLIVDYVRHWPARGAAGDPADD